MAAVVGGDFDGDGAPDLAVGLSALMGRGRFVVEVLLSDGRGGFRLAGRRVMPWPPGGLHAADLDRDGDDDLVVSGGGFAAYTEIKLLLSRGDGGFEESRTYAVDGTAWAAVAEDLDGDGRVDLAVTNSILSQVSVLLNEAPRLGPDSGVRGCGNTFFKRGDLRGDGRAPTFGGAVFLLRYLFADAGPPGCLKAADIDDDGRLSVLDGLLLVRFFFGSAREIPAPFPGCGPDPTEDVLSCEESLACR